jgi:hypothetical protein
MADFNQKVLDESLVGANLSVEKLWQDFQEHMQPPVIPTPPSTPMIPPSQNGQIPPQPRIPMPKPVSVPPPM